MRAARISLCLATTLLACGPHWVAAEPTGSTVVYEPVRREAPPGPPARLPTATATVLEPGRHVVEVRSGHSVVRYEPILDLAYDGDHDEPADPGAPDSAGGRPDAAAESDELALEDRAPSRPSSFPSGRVRPNAPVDPSIYDVHLTSDGLALPYPTTHVFRGFGACRGRRHHHEAIDLGGVGPDWGVGTPIRSMARAEVLFIGTGDDNPADFGAPDKRDGEALRGDRMLPRWQDIEPYGRVYFFTKRKGRWRSGNLIVPRALDGPLAGHIIRYLHIAAPHPSLAVGSTVERGQEIALMGGTGVQESAPHLHLDIQAPDGRRLDVAPLLGLAPTASCGVDEETREVERTPRVERSRLDDEPARAPATSRKPADAPTAARARNPEPAAAPPAPPDPPDPKLRPKDSPEDEAAERDDPAHLHLRPLTVARCKSVSRSGDFSSGRFAAHSAELTLEQGRKVTIEAHRADGEWKPRLAVAGEHLAIKTLASGKLGSKAVITVTAKRDTSLRVTLDGWKPALPRDAAYTLVVRETCPGRR